MPGLRYSIAIGCAWFALLSHHGSVARSQQAEPSKDRAAPEAEAKKSALMHELFLKEIVEHEFSLDIERRNTLELRREPVIRLWELRLLPQPLYRYELTDKESSVVDGAVFVYVWTMGTDPEVLLVIEARRTESVVRWQFAPASFTNREVWLNDQDREVWRVAVPKAGNFDGATSRRYGVLGVKNVPIPTSAR